MQKQALPKWVHTVWLHLYQAIEQEKLISGEKNKSICLQDGLYLER